VTSITVTSEGCFDWIMPRYSCTILALELPNQLVLARVG
jgi:hypothetical protein